MKKNRANVNYQDHSHQEGQKNNTAPDGQPNAHTVSRSISEMKQDSPELVAGRESQRRSQSNPGQRVDGRGEDS